MRKASEGQISKEESAEIERSLEIEPYSVLSLGITPEVLYQIVKNGNNNMATIFLSKISNYPIVGEYLEGFLVTPMNFHMLDVMSRLHKGTKIPKEFTLSFTVTLMKDIR